MSYTPPSGDAVSASWLGAPAYTAPLGDAVNVTWQATPDVVTGVGALELDFILSGSAYHGIVPTGTGALELDFAFAGEARHGVAGAGAVTLSFGLDGEAKHGVAGSGAFTLDIAPAAVAVHPRYEVRGKVVIGGVLVNRRVRAYLRETGVLLGQADTIGGLFRVHAGFVPAECCVLAIDISDDAVDWAPPARNRIPNVPADDAA